MPTLYVVYDTSVYRGISPDRFELVRLRERNHSVVGVCSRWVVTELLAHMAEPHDSSHPQALAALKRLAPHRRTYNGSKYTLPLIGDVEDQIATFVLRRKSNKMNTLSANLAGLVGAVVEQSHPSDLAPDLETLRQLREDVELEEQRFVDVIWRNIYLHTMPNACGWDAFTSNKEARVQALAELSSSATERTAARVLLDSAASRVDLVLSPGEEESLTDEILRLFPESIRLYIEFMARIVREALHLSKPKHRNTLWDLHTAFTCATFARLHHKPLWFITDDLAILKAAAATGNADVIHSLQRYEQLLAEPELTLRKRGGDGANTASP